MPSTHLRGGHTTLLLSQDRDDLFFAKLTLANCLSPLRQTLYSSEGPIRAQVRAVFARLVKEGNFQRLYASDVITSFDALNSTFGGDILEILYKRLLDWSGKFEDSFSGQNSMNIPPELLLFIHQKEISGYTALTECLDEHFKSFEKDDWTRALAGNNDKLLALLIARIQTSDYYPPQDKFLPAILEYTANILDGKIISPLEDDTSGLLYSKLQTNTRKKLANDALLEASNVTTDRATVEHFLDKCAPLAKVLPIKLKPDTTLNQLVVPVLSSNTKAAAAFLKDNRKAVASCIKSASPTASGRLIEALDALVSSGDDGRELAKQHAKNFDVELPRLKDEEI